MDKVGKCTWKCRLALLVGGVLAVLAIWIGMTKPDPIFWSRLFYKIDIFDFLKLVIGTGIGAGIGAWIGTRETGDAAIKAAKVAGDQTMNAMREQVKIQSKIVADKEQKALALGVFIYVNELISDFLNIFIYYDQISNEDNGERFFLSVERYYLPKEVMSSFLKLTSIKKEDKKSFYDLSVLVNQEIYLFKRKEEMGEGSFFNKKGEIALIPFANAIRERIRKNEGIQEKKMFTPEWPFLKIIQDTLQEEVFEKD